MGGLAMLKKVFDLKVIGSGLAVLYAVSLLIFLQFAQVPQMQSRTFFYLFLFVLLFAASLAVVALKEWGRQMMVVVNGIMFFGILMRYIPKFDVLPLAYLFMSLIVLLYFSQNEIRLYFHVRKFSAWKSILVIDDDEIFLKMIRPVLITHGCSVLTARCGEEGLQIAASQKPDLVILDVLLPGIKGREVCKKLKSDKATEHIPVMFITAKDSPDDIQAEMDAGGVAHLTKPLNTKVLISKIFDILEPKHAKTKS